MAKRQEDVVKYTYEDYLTWPEEESIELMDGVPIAMTPAPSREHQRIVVELVSTFHSYLKNHPCDVYVAPFDVRLGHNPNRDDETYTVVQPDLSIICDQTKLDDRGCKGAPDLIIEVVSPSTASNDYIRKHKIYEKYGVKEYWLVHPSDQLITVFLLEDDGFGKPTYFDKGGTISVHTLPGFEFEVGSLFIDKGQ
ncbi:Uma2 family endonuclease [Bacillus suaedae]|uniref:Uma2 family endonuclease n=1 Tax=Halalkalibacter suaedae TaxID=2822140 RepID=A0A940WP40_9BACI|nr:Uma2 family endonuclease [Bacillus suaedae]MBP3950029.1 Uma2 family endonuclease [Bacillus suaedae]